MKVEKTAFPEYSLFKDVPVGDTFVRTSRVFLRIKHSQKSLEMISGKSEVIVSGGFAVELQTGTVNYLTDNTEVILKSHKVVGDV